MIKPLDILHGKILIVDDQQASVRLLEQLLRGAGYDSIATTMDSGEVCALHLVNRYDLILLDLQMPGMDGFQVMENLKEIETGGYLPVLVLTAKAEHKLRALRSGARDFLSKPFELAEVLIRVRNMLEVRLLNLETARLSDRVVAEQQVSRRLLLDVQPDSMAEHLAKPAQAAAPRSAELITESYAEVTVLFADLVGFTQATEGASAKVLAGVLNDLSTRLERSVGDRDLERTRLVGEAYLAAVGMPDAVVDRTVRAATKAFDLAESVDRFNGHSGYQLKVRVGFSTGGAAGKRKALRDL